MPQGSQQTKVPKVLIVDDDVIMRDVLSLVLGAEGYEAILAESGDEALRVLTDDPTAASIILTDMHMPGIHGAALAAKLKTIVSPDTVIVGMSGSQPTAEETSAFRAFLEKPFSAEAFTEAVRQARTDQQALAQTQQANATLAPVLNEEIYARLAAIMPAAQLRELYRMTLDDVHRRVGLMQAAITSGDFATCRSEAHAVKGGCGMVGASELGAMAAELERAAEPLLATLATFADACTRLEDMLDAHTENTGP